MSSDFAPRGKINHHWARPTFLHYRALFPYLNSYYDDEIDYLNKKQRGLQVEPPRAQTYAERAVRVQMTGREPLLPSLAWETYIDPGTQTTIRGVSCVRSSTKCYHTVNYYNRKYRRYL